MSIENLTRRYYRIDKNLLHTFFEFYDARGYFDRTTINYISLISIYLSIFFRRQ